MKGFVRLSHFKTLLYQGVFLGLVITASTVTGKHQTIICPGEQRTTLTCSTNHIFLEWNVSSFRKTETRSISSLDQNPTIAPITMNSADFTFLRVSSPLVLPLVTTMTIMNITSNLEGTMISCSGLNSSSESTIVLMTTVHIYDMDVDIPNAPEITLRPDMTRLGMDNFTVVLEWSQFSGETYSVIAAPQPIRMSFIKSTSVQLVMLYNTEYNVTSTATLCGDSNATTISYYYGLDPVTPTVDCGAPQFTRDNSNVSVNYISTLEGSTLQFSCVEGYLPSDVFTATCLPNGSWVPDPTRHVCTTAASETPSMEQNQNTAFITAIVISTVVVYISSSVLIFIVGCACGWFGHKHKAKGNTHSQATPGPVYEDLQPSTSMQGDPREKATFELKENVAYGPIQSTQL